MLGALALPQVSGPDNASRWQRLSQVKSNLSWCGFVTVTNKLAGALAALLIYTKFSNDSLREESKLGDKKHSFDVA